MHYYNTKDKMSFIALLPDLSRITKDANIVPLNFFPTVFEKTFFWKRKVFLLCCVCRVETMFVLQRRTSGAYPIKYKKNYVEIFFQL